MSGVDVLAVLKEFGTDYKTYIPQFHAQNRKRMKLTVADFDKALAAVAELAAASRYVSNYVANYTALTYSPTACNEANLRLIAALAAFGGSDV